MKIRIFKLYEKFRFHFIFGFVIILTFVAIQLNKLDTDDEYGFYINLGVTIVVFASTFVVSFYKNLISSRFIDRDGPYNALNTLIPFYETFDEKLIENNIHHVLANERSIYFRVAFGKSCECDYLYLSNRSKKLEEKYAKFLKNFNDRLLFRLNIKRKNNCNLKHIRPYDLVSRRIPYKFDISWTFESLSDDVINSINCELDLIQNDYIKDIRKLLKYENKLRRLNKSVYRKIHGALKLMEELYDVNDFLKLERESYIEHRIDKIYADVKEIKSLIQNEYIRTNNESQTVSRNDNEIKNMLKEIHNLIDSHDSSFWEIHFEELTEIKGINDIIEKEKIRLKRKNNGSTK